jgi:hypothetical protein
MPRFTLIKHPYDSEVTVSFDCEMVDVAKAHFDDFLQGSGFSLPEEPDFEFKTTSLDFIAAEDDHMWNEAFDFKFGNDGPVGSSGADILTFPTGDQIK